MDWRDPAVCERLRTLWAEGLSGAVIAQRLGCSKGAVVGAVHRMGLPGRPSPIRAVAAVRVAKPTKRLPLPALASMAPPPVAEGRRDAPVLAVVEVSRIKGLTRAVAPAAPRTHSCLWPMWPHSERPRIAEMRYCGEPVQGERVYCAAHCAKAYVREPGVQRVPVGKGMLSSVIRS